APKARIATFVKSTRANSIGGVLHKLAYGDLGAFAIQFVTPNASNNSRQIRDVYRRIDREPSVRLNVGDEPFGEIDSGYASSLKSGISFVRKQRVHATQFPINHTEVLKAQPPGSSIGEYECTGTCEDKGILSEIRLIQFLLETPVLLSSGREFANSPQEHGGSCRVQVCCIGRSKQACHF